MRPPDGAGSENLVDQEISCTLAGNLPQGEVALYLQRKGDRERVAVKENKEGQEQVCSMSIPIQQDGATDKPKSYQIQQTYLKDFSTLQAVALYRGHIAYCSCRLLPPDGWVVNFEPPKDPKPRIVVRGGDRQIASVVFVLDCSGSMVHDIRVSRETARGIVWIDRKKLDVAKDALNEAIARLAEVPNNPYRVALALYGHRAYWEYGTEELKRVSEKYRDVFPSNDVEVILPLGTLDKNRKENIRWRLQPYVSLGETPLYYAIVKAMKALLRDAPEEGQSTNDGGPANALTNRSKLVQVLKSTPEVKLHILGFHLTDDILKETDARTKRLKIAKHKELRELTKQGVAYLETDNVDVLTDALEKSVAGPTYTVQPYTIERLPGNVEKIPIGKRVTREHDVPFVGEAVFLEGNEKLELFFRGDRLVHRFFQPEHLNRADYALTQPNPMFSGKQFYVAAFRGRVGNEVWFKLTLQTTGQEPGYDGPDRKFTPRPKEVWVEITPELPDDADQRPAYTFYDLDFDAEKPVPMLTYRVPDWPRAGKAMIRLWFKPYRTPGHSEKIGKLTQGAIPYRGASVTTAIAPGQHEHRVVVTERHRPGANLNVFKVEIEHSPQLGEAPPSRVVRRYVPSANTVRHTYYYEVADPQQLRNYRLRLTPREEIIKGAFTCEEPLEVSIPRSGS